jgi:hypothetical protein
MKITAIKLNFNFPVKYLKKSQTPKVMKICTVVANLFHENMDGQTEMAKLIVVSSNFAKALRKFTHKSKHKICIQKWPRTVPVAESS